MKKKFAYLSLALACSALLFLPSSAQQELIIPTHTEACDGSHTSGMMLMLNPDTSPYFETATISAQIARMETMAQLTDCTHPQTVLYHDTDTNIDSYVCTTCLAALETPVSLTAIAARQTSASIRAACIHDFSNWMSFNEESHFRRCSLCMQTETEAHDIVSASCSVDQHCTVCDAWYDGWDLAYGHEMGYVFSVDEWFASGAYTHDYRCNRLDPDSGYTCDYIVSSDSCAMDETYWEAESDGMHECYNVCALCYATGDIWYETCTGSVLCHRCADPNPW